MRLISNCLISLIIYTITFGFILDRPLSLGILHLEINQKATRLAALPTPKLVILAGSNGPYSHSCAVIGPMLNLPCENAGIAVGIGLDFLLRQYQPSLHTGDIIYMPMEFAQYATNRAQNDTGADGQILVRHDRAILLTLPPDRIGAAILSTDFPSFLESTIEMPMAEFLSASRQLKAEYNTQGDRINTTLATAKLQLLSNPSPPDFAPSYGAHIIEQFIAQESAAGVTVIGGLPTGLSATPPSPKSVAAIRALYTTNGAKFAALPNLSRYPKTDFYDSPDHLAQPCQYKHSIAIAKLLATTLHMQINLATTEQIVLARTCPS